MTGDDRRPAFDRDREEPLETYRPALVKLREDALDVVEEFVDGFDSRRSVLEWAQRTTVRTLGEVDPSFWSRLVRHFRYGASQERVLISVLLDGEARERDLDDERAAEVRRRIAARYLDDATTRAYRELRKDAGEYLDDAEGSEHDPMRQRHIAMRPVLDEIDRRQRQALAGCLDGLESREHILTWAADVRAATFGELGEGFGRRCYTERPTAAVLVDDGDDETLDRAREAFAARHLIPRFNQGVRALAGRATEQPHQERQERETTVA